MDELNSCQFDIDNACGTEIVHGQYDCSDSISQVENEVADNMYQRSELELSDLLDMQT